MQEEGIPHALITQQADRLREGPENLVFSWAFRYSPLEAIVAVVDAVAMATGAILVKWSETASGPAASYPAQLFRLLAEDILWACGGDQAAKEEPS